MSRHDPKVTLLQIRDAALKAKEICSEQTSLETLLEDWKATAALETPIIKKKKPGVSTGLLKGLSVSNLFDYDRRRR